MGRKSGLRLKSFWSSFFSFLFILLSSSQVMAQKTVPDGTEGVDHVIHGIDSITGKPESLPANEFENDKSTFKIGLGYIHDFVAYAQDDIFRQQMDSLDINLDPTFKLRDFRILGSGRLKTKRTIAWKFAYMWDGNLDQWLVRESGVTIGVPELAGHLFIGRTKEGFSMVKVMNGHSPWSMERQMAVDLIPILADGIKWFGHLNNSRIFWNIAAYNDIISKGQGFSTFEWQYVGRIGWMPFYKPEQSTLLHIATELRVGKPVDGTFQAKSRPEANPAPFIIETGKFPADHSNHVGLEVYYTKQRFMVGTEVVSHQFTSDIAEDHTFSGGNLFVSYFFTKTSRPYKTEGSIYGFVPVKKSVFKNGIGEIEGLLHFSMFDLNDGSIQGGKFWKMTALGNWYISKVIRFELAYSWGKLDRFDLTGNMQMFQSRIQFTVM